VSALEDRLRRDLRAESGQITPDSLADLRLPGRAAHQAGHPWQARPGRAGLGRAGLGRAVLGRGGPRAGGGPRGASPPWLAWAKPLTAAAAVIAVIAGALALSHVVRGQPPVPGVPPDYASAPAYYAYGVQGDIYNYVSHGTQSSLGVQGRYIKVRATSTGKLLATVSPPKPYNDFSVLTGAANGRAFVFGAMRYWQRNAGPSPRLAARDQTTPMIFLLLRITAGGQVQLSTLSLPETLTPQQGPSAALSPDGTRLAVAYSRGTGPVVQVVTLGSGQVRTWEQPRAAWRPVLAGRGGWSGDGRTLMVAEEPGAFLLPVRAARRQYQPPAATTVTLLDTAAQGGGLASSPVRTLHAPAGRSAPGAVFLTPDGTRLIGSVETDSLKGGPAGELAVYSARTGKLLRTLAPWRWPGGSSPPGRGGLPRQQVAWSSVSGGQLIVLQPRDQLNVLGVLSNGSFAGMGGAMLPGSAAGYRALQYALRSGSQMTW
jgi:hypothetical protein